MLRIRNDALLKRIHYQPHQLEGHRPQQALLAQHTDVAHAPAIAESDFDRGDSWTKYPAPIREDNRRLRYFSRIEPQLRGNGGRDENMRRAGVDHGSNLDTFV